MVRRVLPDTATTIERGDRMANATSNVQRPAPAPSGRMTLTAVRRGKIPDAPKRVLLYGPEGIGKSTFAMGAPAPIFLCPEDGTAELDVARLPEPHAWTDVLDAVRLLSREKHDFQTLVVDTLDWIEPLCWEHVCAEEGWKSIETPGYGKGYSEALKTWRALIAEIDKLRAARGMHVVMLGHSKVATFKNPEGEDYDRYSLKMHDKAGGLLKEWVDAALFANYETFVDKASKMARGKGLSTGARVIHTERRAAFDAKNRYGLPETIPLSWEDFAVAAGLAAPAAHDADKVTTLRTDVTALLATFANDAEYVAKVTQWMTSDSAQDPSKLAEMINRMRARAEDARVKAGAA
jgi:hypothetical protein